jgi:glycosyltransferase involved in cell wall biosynthesis
MKKILLLVESLRINETSSGIVSSTFIKALYELKYKLTVVTPRNFNYPVTWLPDEITVHQFELPVVEKKFIDSIPKLRAVPTYLTGFHSSFRALIDKWKAEILSETGKNSYDYIYILGSGAEFAPHFAVSEMDISIPWIANFHDPYPWHVYPEPYKKKKGLIGRVLERKTRNIISRAYKVSFPSLLLMNHMAKTFPEIEGKGFVVPHIGIELNDLPGKEDDNLMSLQDNRINIVHAGSLLGPRDPQYLIRAILELKDQQPAILSKVNFIFIGKVARELKQIISGSSSENILFYDIRLSYKRSLEIIEKADCMMVIEAISNFSPFMPGKLADIALKEKPIIAFTPDNSEVMCLLGKNYPYHARLDSVDDIKNAIKRFLTDFNEKGPDLILVKNLKKYVSAGDNDSKLKSILN